jgi:hypothetical protein
MRNIYVSISESMLGGFFIIFTISDELVDVGIFPPFRSTKMLF